MDIPQLHLDGVQFPGKAGEYQRRRMTVALTRELGDALRDKRSSAG